MKKFLQYILLLCLSVFILAVVLDIAVTGIYSHFAIRSKVEWARSMKNQDNLDYVLLGSSRCVQHIIPEMITVQTRKKGINFGYASAGLFEIKLLLGELLSRTEISTVFIQLDHSWNNNLPDNLAEVHWLPYIREKQIQREFLPYGSQYKTLANIPLLRYCLKEPKLELRNILFKLSGKTLDNFKSLGYSNTMRKFK